LIRLRHDCRQITLASMISQLTLHADFVDTWDPASMSTLVTRCINASVAIRGRLGSAHAAGSYPALHEGAESIN
jgi:hypothetical protein